MRSHLLLILILSLLFLPAAISQEEFRTQDGARVVLAGGAQTEAAVAAEADDPDAAVDMAHSARTLSMVRQVIEESDLRPFKKRRMLRRLKRPAVATRVTDYVTAQALDSGIINVDDAEMNADGSVASFAVDWNSLLDFIERLIPIILRLIELFA